MPRNMRVWGSNASQELRANAQAQCVYCGHPMEYFDRFDGGRIPMLTVELPSARLPERYRWHIQGGVAYRGDGGLDRCRLPHPVVCPTAEHQDDDEDLNDVRRRLGVATRNAINAGLFTPRVQGTDETEVAEQHIKIEDGAQRHVVRHATSLWLAPTTVDALRCVARAAGTTDERCDTAVLAGQPGEGGWEEVDIPTPRGREGQRVLAAGDTMWVWTVHVPSPACSGGSGNAAPITGRPTASPTRSRPSGSISTLSGTERTSCTAVRPTWCPRRGTKTPSGWSSARSGPTAR